MEGIETTTRARVPRVKQIIGIDGSHYSETVEKEINALALGTFITPAGERFLQYLEGITTRRVLGPEAPDSHLRHLEGARWLVGVIRQRVAAGKKG